MSTYTGPLGVASGIPFTVSEQYPTHELGEKIYTSDGRAFRYVKAGGTALNLADLLAAPAETTGNQSIVVAAAAVGATEVTTTGTVTVTANQYAGGWIVVTGEAGTGTGGMYRIKRHAAATAAVCTFYLEDPIQVALSATTQIDLVENPYNGVVQNPTTPASTLVGVAVNEIAAGYYGWIQVEGPATVKNDAAGAITVGDLVVASQTTVGSIDQAANATTEAYPIVGIAMSGIAQAEYGAVKLMIG